MRFFRGDRLLVKAKKCENVRTNCLGKTYPYNIPNERLCQLCGRSNVNTLLILRKDKFTWKGEKYKDKVHKVCFSCAKRLYSSGMYEFGSYWIPFLIRHKSKKRQRQLYGGVVSV